MSRAAPPRPSPLDLVWQQPRSVLWMMLAAQGLALMLTLALGVDEPFRFFGPVSLAAQGVLLVTLAELYALRPRLRRAPPLRLGYVCLALLLANAVLVAAVTRYTFEPAVSLAPGQWTQLILRLVGIVAVIGLMGLAAFHNYWTSRQMAILAKQAELEALQARIRPHFLFNTLNTAAALLHQRPADAERLLLDLADLFRAALAGPREILVSEEMELVRRYVEIEQQRFGDRLRVAWNLPAELPPVRVPSLSIQPLVENAIRHGVERVPTGARIDISVSATTEHLVVRVSNPLVLGASKGPPSHGVGLSAARARIEAMTGGRGGVETSVQGEHFVATVRLPRPRPASS